MPPWHGTLAFCGRSSGPCTTGCGSWTSRTWPSPRRIWVLIRRRWRWWRCWRCCWDISVCEREWRRDLLEWGGHSFEWESSTRLPQGLRKEDNIGEVSGTVSDTQCLHTLHRTQYYLHFSFLSRHLPSLRKGHQKYEAANLSKLKGQPEFNRKLI